MRAAITASIAATFWTKPPPLDALVAFSAEEVYAIAELIRRQRGGAAVVLGTLSPLGHISPKEFQEVLDLNLTANWRLLRSVDPLLRQSTAGRAIFVSSGAARGPWTIKSSF